jgi:hypothetical protein
VIGQVVLPTEHVDLRMFATKRGGESGDSSSHKEEAQPTLEHKAD